MPHDTLAAALARARRRDVPRCRARSRARLPPRSARQRRSAARPRASRRQSAERPRLAHRRSEARRLWHRTRDHADCVAPLRRQNAIRRARAAAWRRPRRAHRSLRARSHAARSPQRRAGLRRPKRGRAEHADPPCRAGDATCAPCVDALTSGGMPGKPLCTNNGPPSSDERYQALQTCACQAMEPDGCAATCSASACTGGMPDDACNACIEIRCASALAACFEG